jgi:hypothetical protein
MNDHATPSRPVNLDELHDPDFSDGLTPSQHLDVLHGGADPRAAATAAAPEEAGSESIEAICERVRRKYDRSGLPAGSTDAIGTVGNRPLRNGSAAERIARMQRARAVLASNPPKEMTRQEINEEISAYRKLKRLASW